MGYSMKELLIKFDEDKAEKERIQNLPISEKSEIAHLSQWRRACVKRWDDTKVYGWFSNVFPGWLITNECLESESFYDSLFKTWDVSVYMEYWEELSCDEYDTAITWVSNDFPKRGRVIENVRCCNT